MDDSNIFPRSCRMMANRSRSIDLLYLGRETAWQPVEGQVPDPDPRDVVDVDDGDDYDYDDGDD